MTNWPRKPKILYIADVKGWAWWIKGCELQKHLSDEFDFQVVPHHQNRKGLNINAYDLYFTLSWSMAGIVRAVPNDRRLCGVTAHKKKEYFQKTIIPTLKPFRWIHANSILLKKELEKAGFKDIFYVPNGVNEELFNIQVPIPLHRDNLVVGHVGKRCGSGTDAKGHQRFLEPATKKANVIYRAHYNNWKSAIPHEKMPELYQEIDVFLVSSETDGTPNGALEAAACGRPVISNRIGNMPEFIKDGVNGFLVERNVDAYVQKMLLLKEDRPLLMRMGKAARQSIEEGWTWKIMSENYRQMFRTILQEVGLRE